MKLKNETKIVGRLESASDFRLDAAAPNPREAEPVRLRARILSGEKLRHYIPGRKEQDWCEFGEFFIDLKTDRGRSPSVVVDYNHWDDEEHIVGKAENLKLESDGLYADLTLYPKREGDAAWNVAYLARYVPFGISPTVDFLAGTREDVGDVPVECNGREAKNVAIFRGAKILGIAICPYPTDAETFATLLKKTELKMDEKKPDESGANSVKNQELQDYIDACGGDVESGVAAYQSGKTLDEAKEARLAALIEENARLKAGSAAKLADENVNSDEVQGTIRLEPSAAYAFRNINKVVGERGKAFYSRWNNSANYLRIETEEVATGE